MLETRRVEAVTTLAGENIASRRWMRNKKNESSKVELKELSCCQTLANLQTTISPLGGSASIYGSRDDEELTENSTKGSGFLSDVVDKWEKSTSVLQKQEFL